MDHENRPPSADQDNRDNVVTFTPLAKIELKKSASLKYRSQNFPIKHQRMFNIPIATKILICVMIMVEAVTKALQWFYPDGLNVLVETLVFVPILWTNGDVFDSMAIFSPLGSLFAHGGFFHLAVNVISLLAFGSGAEKIFGPKKFLAIFFGCGLVGIITYYAVYPLTSAGVVGASGAISGMFGAVIYTMYEQRGWTRSVSTLRQNPLLMLCLVWIGISLIAGLIRIGDSQPIAWVVHISGFLAGIGFAKVILKNSKISKL